MDAKLKEVINKYAEVHTDAMVEGVTLYQLEAKRKAWLAFKRGISTLGVSQLKEAKVYIDDQLRLALITFNLPKAHGCMAMGRKIESIIHPDVS